MDVGGYRHNYEGFHGKTLFQMSVKLGENDHNYKCPCKPCGNYLLSSLSLLVKSFEEEIQPFGDRVDTARR